MGALQLPATHHHHTYSQILEIPITALWKCTVLDGIA
jgi:hypothetical protein